MAAPVVDLGLLAGDGSAPPHSALVATVRAALSAAEAADVPISIVLDGQNWWGAAPSLWNWWDAGAPGYDPRNARNVEWTRAGDAASAVKIGWRDWGSQIRVAPEQNILAPAVRAALAPRLSAVAGAVAGWLKGANQSVTNSSGGDGARRAGLLAAVKVGWEAGVQYNAFYYPGGNALVGRPPADDPTRGLDFRNASDPLGAGLPVLGYAAAHSAGLDLAPTGGRLTGALVANLTATYVRWLAATVVDAGVPASFVANHVGGQVPPYAAVPFEAAFADATTTPGWSFYWDKPGDVAPLVAAMARANRTGWAAAEWRLPGADEASWLANFNATLFGFGRCTHLAYYNWDDDFERDASGGHAAVRALMGVR